jgi:SSS family solute:Na+ symporter
VINNIFFQYYSLLITIVCIIVFIVVSYATKAPDYQSIRGLTYGTMTEQDKIETRSSWNIKDVLLSVLILGLILAAYLYFTG